MGKGYLGKFNIQKVKEGLILILCIPILCNGGTPCNGISIRKIESGSSLPFTAGL